MPGTRTPQQSPASQTKQANSPVSPLEQEYGVFFDTTVDAAGNAARLMQDLNRTHQILSGLGVVLRIVAGNTALRDEHDPNVEGSPPPLTQLAEGQLVAMAATLCEQMRDQMEMRAARYNEAHRTGEQP